jgi:prepilin-type N-terminal cleavage/methylation domain-containing protein
VRKRSRLLDRKGFSLIELLIAMTLTLILLANGFQLLVTQHRQYIIQDGIAEAQQNLRTGIDMMANEIRLAGYGVPLGIPKMLTMEKEEIEFLANLNAVTARLTGTAQPGQTLLSVGSGQDLQAGKRIYLCDAASCEQHKLAQDGTSHSLILEEPVARQQSFGIGSRVNVVNRVLYHLNSKDPKNIMLMREVDQGVVSLAEQVVSIAFDYLDRNGAVTTVPSDVRRVRIRFSTTSSLQKDRNRAVETEVRLRNF